MMQSKTRKTYYYNFIDNKKNNSGEITREGYKCIR